MIILSRFPEGTELLFGFAIAKPMHSHVSGFGTTSAHIGMNEGTGSSVVSFERCWRLGMAEIMESLANDETSLCIVEQAGCLSFGS